MSDTYIPKKPLPEPDEILISKGQLKREAEAFLVLAQKLVELPKKKLLQVPMDIVVREGVELARRLDSDNARKRQMRYIAKQLSHDNIEAIEAAFDKFQQQSLVFRGKIIEVEGWCKSLIEGDNTLLEQLIGDHPSLERQHLRQLVRQASKDIKVGKSDASQKKLFKYLQGLT